MEQLNYGLALLVPLRVLPTLPIWVAWYLALAYCGNGVGVLTLFRGKANTIYRATILPSKLNPSFGDLDQLEPGRSAYNLWG